MVLATGMTLLVPAEDLNDQDAEAACQHSLPKVYAQRRAEPGSDDLRSGDVHNAERIDRTYARRDEDLVRRKGGHRVEDDSARWATRMIARMQGDSAQRSGQRSTRLQGDSERCRSAAARDWGRSFRALSWIEAPSSLKRAGPHLGGDVAVTGHAAARAESRPAVLQAQGRSRKPSRFPPRIHRPRFASRQAERSLKH